MRDANEYTEPLGPCPPAVRPLHPGNWVAGIPLEQALAAPMAKATHAVPARVEHGRWLVQCPDCGGAQLTAIEDKRFMCVECANVSIDVKWRPVIWPADVTAIVKQLEAREVPVLQHWDPDETAADLAAENELLRWLDAVKDEPPVDWEGHTHTYGATDAEGMRACEECRFSLPASVLADDLEALR